MALISFLSLNGQEITEQGRAISESFDTSASNMELDSGINKRYIKNTKRKFSFKWEWLPNIQSDTIDNRKARDYLKTLAFTRDKILMSIKLDHNQDSESIYVYITDYSEDLIRRSPGTTCDYYSVTMSVEEV